MNILWSVNTLMPEVASAVGISSSHSISWVDAMSKALVVGDSQCVIGIAAVGHGSYIQRFEIKGIIYYVLPSKVTEADWLKIVHEFNPDIIHIYGTEKTHNMSLISSKKISVPIIISLQGILTQYERFYYGGIDVSTLIKNITFRDLVRGTIFKERRDFIRQSKKEQWMLKNVSYVEGRSTWDRVSSLSINPNLTYYHCPRLIRQPFYATNWDYSKIEKYSIFVHQGNYPIKGLHFVFEAMPTILKVYPSAKLYIAGNDILHKKSIKQKILRNGYSKYLNFLFKKYKLADNVVFTGRMSAEGVASFLSKMNVLLIPSVIENCPNSLAEGMIIGVPSVASYVGGNAELLNFGRCGELYAFNEPLMLAESVLKIFSSAELAKQYSAESMKVARLRHNSKKLTNTLLNIYKDVICKSKEQ